MQVLEIAVLAGGATPVGFINSFSVPAPGTTLERLPVHHIDALPHGPRDALVIGGVVSNRRRTGIEALDRLGSRSRRSCIPLRVCRAARRCNRAAS